MSKLRGEINTKKEMVAILETKGSQISVEMSSGTRGKSAYDIWLEEGNSGSKDDFLRWLQNVDITYSELEDKPSIQGVTLVGDKSFTELGMLSISKDDIVNLL